MKPHRVCFMLALAAVLPAHAEPLPVIETNQVQPVSVMARRFVDALSYQGGGLTPEQIDAFLGASKLPEAGRVEALQAALDPLCLAMITINPESRVSVVPGPAVPELIVGDWRVFGLKVHNEAGVTSQVRINSDQLVADGNQPSLDRWLQVESLDERPLTPKLSGNELEYRLILMRGGEAGRRAAVLHFDVGQGTQDLGFRADLVVNFTIQDVHPVRLNLRDENGQPTTVNLEIRDAAGRVYPSQAKRIAPDLRFHPQVYRDSGQILSLPAGEFDIAIRRGPEYPAVMRKLKVAAPGTTLDVQMQRWVDPAKTGWWSGDHHIHAAGCKHYINPTLGVMAQDMALHCRGEDLKIGANLTWGPCFDFQKQFFTGKVDEASRYPYLLRYDVEVSGFGSHRSGHLCLLRLKDQMYPGGDSKDHWPTLCLNTLRWAQKQGAVCGPAHSGWGLKVPTADLPNYNIPPYDGIGANEYIMNVTHEVDGPDGTKVPAVDFLSMVDTPSVWELNIWYHTLNAGYRTRVSGETDFPCIYGDRVGLGRAYVKLDGKLDYDAWCQAISEGRAYVSDGMSHLMDFKVNDVEMGVNGSELALDAPGSVTVTARVAARLEEKPEVLPNLPESRARTAPPLIKDRPYDEKPYWNLERARIENSRQVPVELIVNGQPVARQVIAADGSEQTLKFEARIERSSWVALRILPSSHTNPVFVTVAGKPIRASRKSLQWCIDSLEKCWVEKEKLIAEAELPGARQDYDFARKVYRQRLAECDVD